MVVYVDTSVIVSAIDKGDKRNNEADKFLLREKDKVISPLVLVEIFSVVSRNYDKLMPAFEVEIGEDDLPAVIARLSMRKYGLNLLHISDKDFTIFGEVPGEIKLAFMLAPKLKLRSLDLLHLSYAWNFKLSGYNVDEFATFEDEILRKSDGIKELTGIRVIEP